MTETSLFRKMTMIRTQVMTLNSQCRTLCSLYKIISKKTRSQTQETHWLIHEVSSKIELLINLFKMIFLKSASSFSSGLVQPADQPGPILHTAANAASLTLNYFLISLQSYSIFFLFNFLLTDSNTFIITTLSHSILFYCHWEWWHFFKRGICYGYSAPN